MLFLVDSYACLGTRILDIHVVLVVVQLYVQMQLTGRFNCYLVYSGHCT